MNGKFRKRPKTKPPAWHEDALRNLTKILAQQQDIAHYTLLAQGVGKRAA
ncbi:MAG: hypothetical protein ACLSHC_08505 [Bilophila wadsworthia]